MAMDANGKTARKKGSGVVGQRRSPKQTAKTTAILDETDTDKRKGEHACRGAHFLTFAKALYQESEIERIGLIKNGIPASIIEDIVSEMQISKKRLLSILDFPRETIRRKLRQDAMLSTVQSERVVGLMCLIGQVAVMIDNHDELMDFNVLQWVGEWLEQPVPALGNAKPADFMGTVKGGQIVARLLLQSQAGVFQ